MSLSHFTKNTQFINGEVSPFASESTKDALNSDIQSVIFKASSESLLKMQNPRSLPGLVNTKLKFNKVCKCWVYMEVWETLI